MSRARTQPTEGNSAFVTAATVLGVFAIAQVAAVVWFVANFEPPGDAAEADASPIHQQALIPDQTDEKAPQISRTHTIANIPTVDPATVTPPVMEDQNRERIEKDVAIQNKSALYYLDQGMALRNEGDMQGALVHFNSAASLEKDHPRILYEFAITYEEMDLTSKAGNFWRTIYEMGRVRGGDYYALAEFRLKGKTPKVETVSVPSGPARKYLEIASAIAEPDETVAERRARCPQRPHQVSNGSRREPKICARSRRLLRYRQ